MKRNVIKVLVLYVLLYSVNNLVYWKYPENQQHPTELPRYVHLLTDTAQQELPFIYRFQPAAKAIVKERESPVDVNREYIEQMAALENPDGDPGVVNRAGYMGKFQMGREAFRDIGIHMTPSKFRRHALPEEVQDSLFLAFCALNKYYLSNEIEKYDGKRIRGIRMSQANILAGAHLGGVNSMKRFLKTRGDHDFADGNGTRVSYYLRKFERHTLDLRDVRQPSIPN